MIGGNHGIVLKGVDTGNGSALDISTFHPVNASCLRPTHCVRVNFPLKLFMRHGKQCASVADHPHIHAFCRHSLRCLFVSSRCKCQIGLKSCVIVCDFSCVEKRKDFHRKGTNQPVEGEEWVLMLPYKVFPICTTLVIAI